MESRDKILALLHGEKTSPPQVFSGLVHVTAAGIGSEGVVFTDVHADPVKMASLAASTFQLTGLPSAAVPFDLCVEAQALGARVDFREPGTLDFPRVAQPPYANWEVLIEKLEQENFGQAQVDLSRILLVCRAFSSLRERTGGQAVISGILSGPFTVLSMLVDPASLFTAMRQRAEEVVSALSRISTFIAGVGEAYHAAGADFLTIHEMGGSPAVLGNRTFEKLVFPAVQNLTMILPKPVVLAVCGRLDGVVSLLRQAQARALSVDQSNDLAALRQALPEAVLLGNIDPVGVLSLGTPEDVRTAAQRALQAGADAIWPGCDLVPGTPLENIRALLEGVHA
jgi:[methyl-Co(III) methanol-specific corrinoid protein]:coenzyme M methyltransferase